MPAAPQMAAGIPILQTGVPLSPRSSNRCFPLPDRGDSGTPNFIHRASRTELEDLLGAHYQMQRCGWQGSLFPFTDAQLWAYLHPIDLSCPNCYSLSYGATAYWSRSGVHSRRVPHRCHCGSWRGASLHDDGANIYGEAIPSATNTATPRSAPMAPTSRRNYAGAWCPPTTHRSAKGDVPGNRFVRYRQFRRDRNCRLLRSARPARCSPTQFAFVAPPDCPPCHSQSPTNWSLRNLPPSRNPMQDNLSQVPCTCDHIATRRWGYALIINFRCAPYRRSWKLTTTKPGVVEVPLTLF